MQESILSRLLFTAGDAWLLLLFAAVLLVWEFLRPGRVIPGIAGGIGVVAALVRLSDFHPAPRAACIGVAAIFMLAAAAITRRWLLIGITAAILAMICGHLLLPDPGHIGWLPLVATGPVIFVLAFLISLAGRAWRNKRADLAVSAR